MLEWIAVMHEQFGITHKQVPSSSKERMFRYEAFLEEAKEYLEATTDEARLDALVDLVVFALGAVEREGYLGIWDTAYRRVMEANLNKTLGPNTKRGSYELDLIKPEGWKPADLSDLFQRPRIVSND